MLQRIKAMASVSSTVRCGHFGIALAFLTVGVEYSAHIFLEKRGETLTVKDLRDYMKLLDLDANHAVAMIEYLLFKCMCL